jgi:hypothetical protein
MGLINVDHSNHQSSSPEPFKVQVTHAGGQSSLVQLGQGSRGTFSSFGPKTHAGLWFFGRTMENFGNPMPWNAINLPFGNGINVCRGQNMACGVHPSHTGNPYYEILWVYGCFLKMGDPVIPSDWFGYVTGNLHLTGNQYWFRAPF